MLTGGIGTLDASVVSPDHAVSLEPLLIERVEVVRGPASLLYGGGAIGGVVNVVDGRIPEELPGAPVVGRFEVRGNSVADERAAAGVVSGASGPLAWRIDGAACRKQVCERVIVEIRDGANGVAAADEFTERS